MTATMELLGVILAGGRSRRMGTDKGKLLFAGRTYLERAESLLGEVVGSASRIYVSCLDSSGSLVGTPVPDLHPGFGPVSGIHAALSHILTTQTLVQRGSIWMVVIPIDMPLLNVSALLTLVESSRASSDVVDAVTFEGHELPLILRVNARVFSILDQMPFHLGSGKELSLRQFLSRVRLKEVSAEEADADSFTNVNRPIDCTYLLRRNCR